MSDDLLAPLILYDQKNDGQLVETLEKYFLFQGSYTAMAENMYTHRNTLMYRMNKIKKLLGTDLSTSKDMVNYQIACLIMHMNH